MAAASIFYDADCGFCRWSLAWVLRLDRRAQLRPVALQDPEADAVLAAIAREERTASWHLVTAEGRVYSGGYALAPLLRLLPGGGPVARVLGAFPRACDLAYRGVAARRSLLGRLIPTASAARARKRIEAAERHA